MWWLDSHAVQQSYCSLVLHYTMFKLGRGNCGDTQSSTPCPHRRLQASLWNFVKYNVVGGGQSSLYGVEGPLFYLHNGALAFNAALPLALALPALALLRWLLYGDRRGKSDRPGQADSAVGGKAAARSSQPPASQLRLRMAAALAPLWLWLAAISALPHKEERFLYVVYPLVHSST